MSFMRRMRMFKRIKNILLCSVLCLALMSTALSVAAAGEMKMSWKGDYTNSASLVVTFTSPAAYTQQVTAVLYNDEVSNPGFSDYLRMKEVTSRNGNQTTFSIPLGNDLNAADGKYKLTLTGNGVKASECVETIDVTILIPSNLPSLLTAINSANSSSAMYTALSAVDDALQLNLPASCESLMSELLTVRNGDDYSGSFDTLNEVNDAYAKAYLIDCLKSSGVSADGLCEYVEKYNYIFGLDLEQADYVAYKNDIYTKVISLKSTFGGDGIGDWREFVSAVEKTTAVVKINNCETGELESAVLNYKNLIGLSSDDMAGYNSLPDTNKQIVLRNLYMKSFNTVEEVKTAFVDAVDVELEKVADNSSTNTDNNKNNNGNKNNNNKTDMGTISFGGGGTQTSVATQPTGSFSDVNTSHWAYEYVSKLSGTGIISGYPDGTFRPEAAVTREEFIKMVVSAAGLYDKNAECEFSDVNSSDWFYRYVASAKANGIVNGISDTTFGAGVKISRQDVAVIVERLLVKAADEQNDNEITTKYLDDEKIADYAKTAVVRLSNLGILSGHDDGTFAPEDFLTRAQAAKVIAMFREKL